MPWQERRTMSLKMEFVERAAQSGAKIAPLCREFGISRETGHKWLRRFRAQGHEGLEELSRRPKSIPLAKAEQVVLALLEAREAHPRWGPKKLVALLRPKLGKETPSRATAARILRRFGKVQQRRKKAAVSVVDRVPDVVASAPNDVWTVDFKGWWVTEDGSHCEPLTVRDGFSRFVLAARRMAGTKAGPVRAEFERLFRKYGIPRAIQCDNGSPFVCRRARGGLTKLSAWWISLGVRLVRSRPACPQDNGAHERMHREVRADVQAARGANARAAQRSLDRWRQEFNHVRPHEALQDQVPADVYCPGTRRSLMVGPHTYPPGWIIRRVSGPAGRISIEGETYTVGTPLCGQQIGLEPLGALRYRVWLRHHDLGLLELAPPRAAVDAACDRFLDAPGKAGKKQPLARCRADSRRRKT
jgi:putative transposase